MLRFALLLSLFTLLAVTAGLCAQDTMKVTANELIFQNAKNAATKYGDSKLEFTETIHEFGSNAGSPAIEFKPNPNGRVLICLTNEAEPWAVFTPGQRVKVVGKWSNPAQLSGCEVTALGKPSLIAITAEQLGKHAHDERDFAKYKGSSLLVTGKVLKTAVEKSGFTSVVLAGSGKFVISTQAPVAAQERAKGIKPGDTVTIAGKLSFHDPEGEVFLTGCWPVTKK